eukprot:CAMPEP_0201576290 /NCGR_PEP_ID=MMETSP0190_2-20130828/22024_1 /ASSEMBLY_ACC=CAM_ASM_000263 /TAXON_ID=37353 /ORGANISM="Rosalina sp." /LENGTH=798 /DNA_ID=CAMNT_0048006991 /DNA_START=145 /DNA_END=2541 /DNA_ORIENTATION=+
MSSKKKGGKGKKGAKKGALKGSECVTIAMALNKTEWTAVIKALPAASNKALKEQLGNYSSKLSEKKKSNLKSGKSPAKAAGGKSGGKDKIAYKFGSRTLNVTVPADYSKIKAAEPKNPKGGLQLTYAHGYSGNFDESRQNVYLTSDGKNLIYYIAAVVVVMNVETGKQEFFTRHNDDITTVAVQPGPGDDKKGFLVASGQKDPKDEPGAGKDLPKVYVWYYKQKGGRIKTDKSIPKVCLIDDVCWGKIARLQFSNPDKSNLLYCLCGDADQTLKAWSVKDQILKGKNGKDLDKPRIACNTMRELILGFVIREDPADGNVDEFLVYGKRKFGYCTITGKDKLAAKIKSVSTVSLKKDGEKSFATGCFLPGTDGKYAVGSQSGAIYIGKANTALAILQSAHDKSVGAMCMAGDKLLTAGSDRKFKTFDIDTAACGTDGKSGLTNNYECEIEVKESDMVMLPRAIAYDGAGGIAYCGTKTNQIVRFKFDGEDSSVIVDGHDGQIWALATSPNECIFATGGYDNAVKIWDAKTRKCVATYEFEKDDNNPKGYQFCSGHWSNNGDILAFGTEDSNIAIFTYRGGELKFLEIINIPPKNENAEVEGVAYLRFSGKTEYLAAAHMDSNLYIYSIGNATGDSPSFDVWAPMGHVAAPTNVQFNADATMVKTLTRDYEIAHWTLDGNAKKGSFAANQPHPDKMKWTDDPLIAGWDTQGLYQKGWDGTDLNDATVTSDNKFIASGDDYGNVRLHSYPAINPDFNKKYGGHAEFVVGVEFLRDDSQLITCGGNDMAIFQWKLNVSKDKK